MGKIFFLKNSVDWTSVSGYNIFKVIHLFREWLLRFLSQKEEVNVMCNLSQGIREDENEKIILNMRKEGDSLEKIARIVGKTSEEVQATIEKKSRLWHDYSKLTI